MANWAAEWIPVKRGERLITSIMFLYIFGVLTFYYILKPLKDGLFLANYPSSDLPYPNLITAIFAGTLATLVFKLARRISAVTLITGTNAAITLTLFVFFVRIGRDSVVLPYVFYIYVQIVSVLSAAQFWLLASFMFDSRQAKRIYVLLGAGAIAGAMAGSAISGLLYRALGRAENMLLICIAISILLILLGQFAWRYRQPGSEPAARASAVTGDDSQKLSDLLRMVFGSRHLTLMVGLICFTLISSQIADWQVKDALYHRFQDASKLQRKEQITEFLATLNLFTNVAGILLQLLITNFVVRKFGITAAVTILPAAVFTCSWGVLLAPSLWTTVATDASDAVFRYSLMRAGIEFLYLPLPPVVRKRLKFFLDVFIDRFGRFIAAVTIWIFVQVNLPPAWRVRGTAVAVLVFSAASIAVGLRLKKSYNEAFRAQLATREIDLQDMSRYVSDPASIRLLLDALASGQERQIRYGLILLQSARGVDFSQAVLPLLEHGSPQVRAEAVRTLAALPGLYHERIERMLRDEAQEVRRAAVDYLCSRDSRTALSYLHDFCSGGRLEFCLAAAECLSSQREQGPFDVEDDVARLLKVEGPERITARMAAGRLAARLPRDHSIEILGDLLADANVEVRKAALKGAGSAGHPELLDSIVARLRDRTLRSAAREALVSYGPRAHDLLGSILSDNSADPAIRRELPWVLARMPTTASVNILATQLGVPDPLLKYRVVKALNRLHEARPDLPVQNPVIARQVYSETRAYYEALVVWDAVNHMDAAGGRHLLTRALRERLDQNLEIIFRLLGLQYPQRDIYSAYTALRGERRDRRSSALEFLDNLLNRNLKTMIMPLLEESAVDQLVARAGTLFGIPKVDRKEALRMILRQKDNWLRACALHEIGEGRILELLDICRKLSEDPEPLVRETAQWVLQRFAPGE